MADKRRSRVRGAEHFKQRTDWPYPLPHFEWAERLNFVRQQIGDRQVSVLTGVSLTDPTYKTVRRWAAGTRIPKVEIYNAINQEYGRLQKRLTKIHLVDVPSEIRGYLSPTAMGKVRGYSWIETLGRYVSKVNLFIHRTRPYAFRREPPVGFDPASLPASRMIDPVYMRTCDNGGDVKKPGRRCAACIVVHVVDLKLKTMHMETYVMWREDSPSLSTMKNAIDTWIEGMPKNVPYKAWTVVGVWFSYY